MLFYLKYFNHDVEKLHELISFFFEKIETENPATFTTSLLPAWYSTTVNRLEKLESQLTHFLSLSKDDKTAIIKAFSNGNIIGTLFSNKTRRYAHIPVASDFKKTNADGSFDNSIEVFLNELFVDNLYIGQLGKKDSTFSKKIGCNLGNHFIGLKDSHAVSNEDFSLCPFCGIEPIKMINSEGRPDYDHLLAKGDSLFVFSSINLKNLVPIGDHCNGKKSSQHLLYSDKARTTRTISFYPFDATQNPYELYHFELICKEYPDYSNLWKGKWEVNIKPNVSSNRRIADKIETWNRVFNIKSRYEEYLEIHGKSMLDKILRTIDSSKPDLLMELKSELNNLLTKVYLYDYIFISTEEGLIPKRIMIEWYLKDEAYLLSYLNFKKLMPANQININSTLFE
ncbi:hypothetical protein SAMN05216490_0034 [Mucilaginibacter mallensis]|uniref:HNH endonuclease n=1 Tax=Mucilaginibacter mallensis TaxID=652787 RepID=A0A1H1MAF2_MUCMA|nr:hypothetical protein [Mucilaginibacter mallensis]SDR83794.1 hypothetical protein SAMN05216490_0034 [Mucilaginibacter mallensis]